MSTRKTPKITIDDTTLRIELSRLDQIAGLVRSQTISVTAITDVEVVNDPLQDVAGIRSPGLGVPGVTKVGTWRRHGRRTLVVVRRGQRAVRIEADHQRFDSYLIGVDDPHHVASQIRKALET